MVQEVLGVIQRLHAVHVVVVDAGEVGTDRNASRRDERLVEPEVEGAVLLDRAYLDLASVDVEPDDLVAHPDVDAEPSRNSCGDRATRSPSSAISPPTR